MLKVIVLLLFYILTVQASFIKKIAIPDMIIDYKSAIMLKNKSFNYQEVDVKLTYTTGILFFAPVGLWMDLGIKIQEKFYNNILFLKKPDAISALSDIIQDIAMDKPVTQEEMKKIKNTFKFDFTIPYRPFKTRLDYTPTGGKHSSLALQVITDPQEDVTYKTYHLIKVDVINKDNFNFFFLFPKKDKLLTINKIILPPMIFCEYGGLFYMYQLDIINKSASLYSNQFGKYDYVRGGLTSQESSFMSKITDKPSTIINKNINKFLLIYSKFLKEKF